MTAVIHEGDVCDTSRRKRCGQNYIMQNDFIHVILWTNNGVPPETKNNVSKQKYFGYLIYKGDPELIPIIDSRETVAMFNMFKGHIDITLKMVLIVLEGFKPDISVVKAALSGQNGGNNNDDKGWPLLINTLSFLYFYSGKESGCLPLMMNTLIEKLKFSILFDKNLIS
ncbi:hypothetical protein NQ317_008706 [Molorchus minor]|uniref:Uncharacterized protein n=1 Tax=Molorchus minor TaxID=1323400 RepID=A0ABQ9JCT4_9CUCU|nr:hypothetical protein NQ317_008706 [Molorchus minor]